MAKKSKKIKILFGLSGSVASIKWKEIADHLSLFARVKIIMSRSARNFVRNEETEEFEKEKKGKIYKDEDDWNDWTKIGDSVLHIDLRKWADVFLVAPLSANKLSDFANGRCDDIISCVARAWDFEKPFFVAPAMNTFMWNHPFTSLHLDKLRSIGIIVIDPIEKLLACGDFGIGAMASVDSIVAVVKDCVPANQQRGDKKKSGKKRKSGKISKEDHNHLTDDVESSSPRKKKQKREKSRKVKSKKSKGESKEAKKEKKKTEKRKKEKDRQLIKKEIEEISEQKLHTPGEEKLESVESNHHLTFLEQVDEAQQLPPRLKPRTNESNAPFQRVKADDYEVPDLLKDNSYVSKKGDSWGANAAALFQGTRGKNYRQTKTKKKKGGYHGGTIDLGVNSFKFSYND